MTQRWMKRAAKITAIGLVALGIFGFIVMSLWNWLGPSVFGLRPITFWQALGILILAKILFGGFRGRPGYGGHWRRRMRERWDEMSPEERERFRQGAFGSCGRARGMPTESPESQKL